jgi:hypothetical protein
MILPVPATDSAREAGRILHALRDGDLHRLEPQLDRTSTLSGVSPKMPSAEAERWELLESIVDHMRDSLASRTQCPSAHLKGVEVYVRLLEHLNSTPTGSPPLQAGADGL